MGPRQIPTWLRNAVLVLVGLNAGVVLMCGTLAFAVGWVGPYAPVIEPLGAASSLGSLIFGLATGCCLRDHAAGKTGPKK